MDMQKLIENELHKRGYEIQYYMIKKNEYDGALPYNEWEVKIIRNGDVHGLAFYPNKEIALINALIELI